MLRSRALAKDARGPPLDILICNAGVLGSREGVAHREHEQKIWADGLGHQRGGPYLSIAGAAAEPAARPQGRIACHRLHMGSSAPWPAAASIPIAPPRRPSSISARNLAVDLKPLGIAVGAYHPGWVRTDMGGANAASRSGDQRPGPHRPHRQAVAGHNRRVRGLSGQVPFPIEAEPRHDRTARFTGTKNYVATDDLKVAVNAAITLERPLLVKGEPGTGKTVLAIEVAKASARR